MRLTNYPVTIFAARYGGAYEGGEWVAVAAHQVPPFAVGGDVDCARFFELNHMQLGIDNTPETALDNLIEKVGYNENGFINMSIIAEQESWYS